jgi:hypothetical protein
VSYKTAYITISERHLKTDARKAIERTTEIVELIISEI